MRKFRSITSSIDANVYVGPFGEIVVDDSNTLRLQDNVTPGGHLVVPDTGNITFTDTTIGTSNNGAITLNTNAQSWTFGTDGNLTLPVGGTINFSDGSNALVGGSSVADTGNITFNDATISTSNISGIITVDSNLFAVTNAITVGNIVIDTDIIKSVSNLITITANTHSIVFNDVSTPGFNIGTGVILTFDNIEGSIGPSLETWYGETGNPYDPPGQHSLDIRVASDAVNDYVEFASFDWNNFLGLSNDHVWIFTDWQTNPEQAWFFNKSGELILPSQGIIKSHTGNSAVIVADSNVYISSTNQNSGAPFGLLIESGDFVFDGNVLPSGNATVDLGSPDRQWQHLYVSSNTIYIGGASLTVTNGNLLVNGMIIGDGTVYDQSLNIADNVTFNSVVSDTYVYTPEYRIGNEVVSTSAAPVTVLGAATSVVYTFDNWFTSAKFVFQTEGQLDGDSLFVDHTQTCEATVAATYNTTADPIMSVYGVVYTSIAPLATFTVRRGVGINAGKIEILATNSQTTNDLTVKVHATQFVSRYD
jgi:hypothetical protein